MRDLVLNWDAPRQDRGKHNKFDSLVKFCEQFDISLIHPTPYYP